jgi:hypothetical protein
MQPIQNNSTHAESRREGVALVIVLGILSVLVIMGIAFSITTKTERTATRAYVDVVRARQLTHTALNRVMGEHINGAMNGRVYPSALNESFSSGTDTDTNNVVFHLGDQSRYSGAIFVPMSMRSAAFAADGARWIELRDQDNNLQGEYSFLVINNSGLLDAMVIGEREGFNPVRLRGTDPGEIRFSPAVLPEVRTGVSLDFLRTNRTMFGRFESVSELYYLLSSADNRLSYRGPPVLRQLNDSMADHLHVFSRFPFGYANDDLSENRNVGYIGGDPALWDFSQIESALSGIDGNPIPDIPAFIRVMHDYASEGYEFAGATPTEKFERISSKRVPMINEIVASNSFELIVVGESASIKHAIYVTLETWFPFNFDVSSEQFRVLYNNNQGNITNIMTAPAFFATVLSGEYELESEPPSFSPAPNSYFNHTFVFSRSVPVALPPGPVNLPIISADVYFNGEFEVIYDAPGQPIVVDRVNMDSSSPIILDSDNSGSGFSIVAGSPVFPDFKGYSVNDPRVNWSMATNFIAAAVTLNDNPTNANVSASFQDDEVGVVFSKHGEFESVGELSFLLFNENFPWGTLRLTGDYHQDYPFQSTRVFDRLSVFPPGDFPKRGLVNPNTRQRNPLIAAFYDAPIERFPSTTWTNALSTNQAIAIVDDLVSDIQSFGAITNRSHLIDRIDGNDLDVTLDISGDKFTRESVMRNSLELFNPRHGMFTIFVAARVFSDAYDPSIADHRDNRYDYVTGEQRAMAVVWRDPYTTTDGAGNSTHQSWIQYFHWFSGAFEN